uniref:Uncharacterized protein n=1 Tax=Chrysotila carterae TaxID=13221 RepID=A0A7S4BV18_CHRCT
MQKRGPTLKSLIMLPDSTPEPTLDLLQPAPLQRPYRPVLRPTEVVRPEDCINSHAQQKKIHDEVKREERRQDKLAAKAERAALRAQHINYQQLNASRREVAKKFEEQCRQQEQDVATRELQQYIESRTAEEYWPFGRNRPGPPNSFGKEAHAMYGDFLKSQAEDQKLLRQRRAALDKASPPPDESLLHKRLAQLGATEPLAKHDRDARAEALRERVRVQAESRSRHSQSLPCGSNDERAHLHSVLKGAAMRDAAEQWNRKQLRSVLERQMADKEQRDLSEHKRIYGALASIESASEARDAAAAAATEAAAAAARNRRELEAQIASKQRERKTLKEKLKAEQARDDRDQVRRVQLQDEAERLRQKEKFRELEIEWAGQASAIRRHRRHAKESDNGNQFSASLLG